jgi:hypothetical protein
MHGASGAACGDWLQHRESAEPVQVSGPSARENPAHVAMQLAATIERLTRQPQRGDFGSSQPTQMPSPCRGAHCGQAPSVPAAIPTPTVPRQHTETLMILCALPSEESVGESGYIEDYRCSLAVGEPQALLRPPRAV